MERKICNDSKLTSTIVKEKGAKQIQGKWVPQEFKVLVICTNVDLGGLCFCLFL